MTSHEHAELDDAQLAKKVVAAVKAYGCADRISRRLIAMCDQSAKAATTNGKALVVIKDHAIKDFMKDEGIRLCSGGRSRAAFSDRARVAGANAGDRASFGKPVSGSGAVLRIGKA